MILPTDIQNCPICQNKLKFVYDKYTYIEMNCASLPNVSYHFSVIWSDDQLVSIYYKFTEYGVAIERNNTTIFCNKKVFNYLPIPISDPYDLDYIKTVIKLHLTFQ